MTHKTAPAGASSADLRCCPSCGRTFHPRRKDMRYCQKSCARSATRNATQNSRTLEHSPNAKRRSEERTERILNLTRAYYDTPPAWRAAFLEALIEEARQKSELAIALTKRAALHPWRPYRCPEGGVMRRHIAAELDHYCQEVRGARSFDVLNPERPLVAPEHLCFPAVYFGPDAPPIYEDGSLQQRPCPWEEWKRCRRRQKSLHPFKGEPERASAAPPSPKTSPANTAPSGEPSFAVAS